MPKLPFNRLPAYRSHKPSGQAVVTLDGKDIYLGVHGTAASRAAYEQVITEWIANGRRLPTACDEHRIELSVTELIAAYWRHVEAYYIKDGQPTSEQEWIRYAMKPLRRLYGHTRAAEFGPLALKAVTWAMIDDGASRSVINGRTTRIRRLFKWAASQELVPASVYHALQTVPGLRVGRSPARETDPVLPVSDEHIDAIKPFMPRQVRAMIELQKLSGMRPGEVIIMRGVDLDMTGHIWHYRPSNHKTAHHGHQRVVDLGPRGQGVIRPFLKPDLQAYLFSPLDVTAERRGELRRQRKTPVQPSQRNRRKRCPKHQPKNHYTTTSYRRAIARACDKAFPPHEDLSEDAKKEWRKQHRWHPHQLRHNFATRIRREHGLEAARILLGHRTMAVTEVYAEIDRMKVADIVSRTG